MPKTTHTPGPWEVNPADKDQVWGTGERAVRLAQAIHWPKHDAEANARLIAAAPELLAALNEFVADLLAHSTFGINAEEAAMLRRAESAIAKATNP
jgi:hypothetical protein